jgi:hypothetical protein
MGKAKNKPKDALLLPYQAEWVNDRSRLKLAVCYGARADIPVASSALPSTLLYLPHSKRNSSNGQNEASFDIAVRTAVQWGDGGNLPRGFYYVADDSGTCRDADADGRLDGGDVVSSPGLCYWDRTRWSFPGSLEGSGDVTAVGPGCPSGACFSDGVVTSGTAMLVWEGTTDDGNELTIFAPSADPGADIAITLPETSSTLAATSSPTSRQYVFGPFYNPLDSDDALLFAPLRLVFAAHTTVASIDCVAQGGGTISLRIRECTDASMTTCVDTMQTMTCDEDGETGAVADDRWESGDWIAYQVDAPNGQVDSLTFSLTLIEPLVH